MYSTVERIRISSTSVSNRFLVFYMLYTVSDYVCLQIFLVRDSPKKAQIGNISTKKTICKDFGEYYCIIPLLVNG